MVGADRIAARTAIATRSIVNSFAAFKRMSRRDRHCQGRDTVVMRIHAADADACIIERHKPHDLGRYGGKGERIDAP